MCGQFQIHRKITEQKVQRAPIHPLLPHMHSPPTINIPHQRDTLVRIALPTLIHYQLFYFHVVGFVHSFPNSPCFQKILRTSRAQRYPPTLPS